MSQSPKHTASPADTLSAAKLDVLVRQLPSLPTFPCVAAGLMELMADADRRDSPAASTAEAISLIECDPPMTALLLSLAAAGGARVCTVRGAVEAVGFDALRSAVLSTKVFDSRNGSPDGLDRPGLWKHSIAVALAAQMLCRHMSGPVDGDEVYVCGLLHNLGKLAMDYCMPKSYRRVLDAARLRHGYSAECERRIIGVEQSAFGRRLAEHWRLPQAVQEAIWLARHPARAVPPSVSAPNTIPLVNLADTIARELQLGFSDNRHFPRSSGQLAGDLGISPEALGQVVSQLGPAVEARYELLGLRQQPGEALHRYRTALADANTELGRLNAKLLDRTETLVVRAAALEHLRDFAADLTAEATVADVLAAMTAVIAAAGAAPVAAYSIGAGDEIILAACDTAGRGASYGTFAPRAALDAGVQPPTDAAAALAMIAADGDSLGKWVDSSLQVHQGLLCAGRWIGGVFYCPRDASAGDAAGAGEIIEAVASPMALVLAIAQGRSRQMLLGEQLAGASQALSADGQVLAEAKALNVLGEMAAGAAHELNTPLAVISGRAQIMGERAGNDDERKTWRLIADQAHRISDIISELMAFASPTAVDAGDFDVGQLLRDVAESFTSSDHPQAATAEVDIQVGEGPLRARADRDQIRAAILELMVNAANAAAGETRIRLAAESDGIDAKVLLTVSDAGTGMDERTVGRAFTPFFSAQKAGRRRGMGLPRVKRIIENNGGRIWIDSQVDQGTTVTVQLPMA